jgi:LPXTG-site transpeptidase (sortase) family protein
MKLESIKKEIKTFGKYFIPLFIFIFLVINWVDFGWAFNYRTMGSLVSERLQDTQEESVKPAEQTKETEQAKPAEQTKQTKQTKETVKEKNNLIEIPKIGISAPIIFFSIPTEDKVVHDSLDFGTVHYPSSVFPGENGQTIILGHSAPANWPKIKYDWVFTDLNSLVSKDEINIYFKGEKHVYYVKDKVFLDKGEELPEESYAPNENILVLLSCWPPGKDIKRIAVIAYEI